VGSAAHFALIFKHCDNARLRLATLATFWNASSLDERWDIFTRFLSLVAGPAAVDPATPLDTHVGPHLSHFRREVLTPLPLHNYEDLVIPAPWVTFYAGLPPAARVELFNTCWDLASPQEQALIITDIKTFYLPGGADGETPASADDAEPAAGPASRAGRRSGAPAASSAWGGGGGAGGGGARATTPAAAAALRAGLSPAELARLLTAAGAAGRPLPILGGAASRPAAAAAAAATPASSSAGAAAAAATDAAPAVTAAAPTDSAAAAAATVAVTTDTAAAVATVSDVAASATAPTSTT